MTDAFPASFEILFRTPAAVDSEELRVAVEQLAETLKADLVATGAPVEVIMEASVSLSQFAKHMQASSMPYGKPGAYDNAGAERMSLSSIHTGLTSLREALLKLRIAKASPVQVEEAVKEYDRKFVRATERLFKVLRGRTEPLAGEDLMFWVQHELFGFLQEEGLVD